MSDVRSKICGIISEMLDNPDDVEIYPTTKCYDALEGWISNLETDLAAAQRELAATKRAKAERDELRDALEVYVAKFGDCGAAYDEARAALAGEGEK